MKAIPVLRQVPLGVLGYRGSRAKTLVWVKEPKVQKSRCGLSGWHTNTCAGGRGQILGVREGV